MFDNKGHALSPPLLFVPFYSAPRNLYGIFYLWKWMNCVPPSMERWKNRKPETRNRKPETGNHKPETGNRKLQGRPALGDRDYLSIDCRIGRGRERRIHISSSLKRDSVPKFSTCVFFSWISFPEAPEYTTLAKLVAKFAAGVVDWWHNLPLVSLIRRQILPPVSYTQVANFPPVSLIPVVHLDLRISPRIFEKNLKRS